tara:strand:- start:896 stop:1186 length:291 start_codon:yes stop_codon:yes gene_type:complete
VDTQARVVEMVVSVIEVVQNQAEFAGQAIVETAGVCVLRAVGQEQVGVQQELHEDVVLWQITGAVHLTMDTAVSFVMHVIIVGKTVHTVEILTEAV